MNKTELVKVIADELGLTQKDVTAVIDKLVEVTTGSLKKGQEVSLPGLGKFAVAKRAARTSMNPRTKELVKVPARKAPVFKPAKALKDAVN